MSGLSNWREEFNLSEVVTGKMTDKEALKKVSEKSGINNKVTINPKLDEAVKEIGGEVIGMVEQDTTAQKQRIDMKQMILDRQKLKIRRKDLSAAKKEQQNDVEGDSTNASKQSNVIAQEDKNWIQKATKNMRKDKPCTGEKFGSESCPPGSKRYNLAKTFRKMAKEETEVNEGLGASMAVTAGLNAVGNIAKAYGASQAAKGAIVGGALSGAGALGGGALNYMASRNTNKKKSDAKPQGKKKEVKEGVMKMVKRVMSKKKPEKKAEKAMDAGARARRKLQQKDHETVNFLPMNEGKKKGLWDNIHAKRERIKSGSGEKKAKPGDKDYPKTLNVEDKAFEFVKKKIEKEVGKRGYVSKDNPRKPPTAAQKKAAAAHQAKVDAENAAERAKDPSQGRYPKG